MNAEHQNTIQRIRRVNQRVPGTDVLFYDELSGADGAHFELLRESHHTPEDIKRAKAILRGSRDVTGFTTIQEGVSA